MPPVPTASSTPLHALRSAALWAGIAALAACGPAPLPPGDTVADSQEAQNRATHRFNLALDRTLVGPTADAYGDAIPRPVRRGVANFASNLSQPGYVLNNLLQVRIGNAAQNTLRFAINTTLGIGGLFDPATALGVPAEETDFGETMHVYGLGEGDYHVLPVFGPSTTRDSVGMVVDFALNPLRHMAEPPHSTFLSGTRVLSRFGDRHDYAGTIDDILYDSSDSYLQMRSLYLQNRRYELGGGSEVVYAAPGDATGDATGTSEAGADIRSAPYADPYLDPYSR